MYTYRYTDPYILCFVTGIKESHLSISWKLGTGTYVLNNGLLSQNSLQVTVQALVIINIKTYMIITEGRKIEMYSKISECSLFGFPYNGFSVDQHQEVIKQNKDILVQFSSTSLFITKNANSSLSATKSPVYKIFTWLGGCREVRQKLSLVKSHSLQGSQLFH